MIYTIKGEQPFQVLTDAFSIGPSNEGYTLQVSSDGFNYSDLFSVGPNITRMVTGVASGSYYRMKNNASEVSVNWIKDCGGSGSGGGSGQQGPMGPEGAQGYQGAQGAEGTQGAEGAQGPAGDPASGSGIPIVSSLRDAEAVAAPVGSFVGVYSDSARTLYQKVSGGTIAEMVGNYAVGQTAAFHLKYENLEDFVDFANGKTLFSTKSRSQATLLNAVLDKANMRITLMTENSATTYNSAVYLGNAVSFRDAQSAVAQHSIMVKWEKDGIYFYDRGITIDITNLLNFTTEGIYFKKIEDVTKADREDLGFTGTTAGIPKWNKSGVIVGKESEAKTKAVAINTNAGGSASKVSFLLQGGDSNLPATMYVPTAAGSQGQILTFVNATTAPAWTDWIKSVSITQDAYDALVEAGTTDPNTLYLIVEE